MYARFGGVFHETQVFLNGVFAGRHENGYTSFLVRLDNSSLTYGTEPNNVLAMFVNALSTSSWWYAGGGIYRHVEIFATDAVHVAEDGVRAIARIDEAAVVRRGDGAATGTGYVDVTVEVANDDADTTTVTANASLVDASGAVVASCASKSAKAEAGVPASLSCTISAGSVDLWSVASPSVYTVAVTLLSGGVALDDDSATVGFRSMQFNTEQGFLLNGQRVSHTGFCDHNDQAVVGMAVPDRLFLHRFQMLRAIGGNARRMSHNSPADVVMALTDRLGVLTMPENRNFLNASSSFQAWHDLIKHHRNHPSVAFFSECNEVGEHRARAARCTVCTPTGRSPRVCPSLPLARSCPFARSRASVAAAPDLHAPPFRSRAGCYDAGDALPYVADTYKTMAAALAPDATITANQFSAMIGNAQSITLDVQGFSHQGVDVFQDFHEQFPKRPVMASECCSCESQRDEDDGTGHYSSFNADCVNDQTNWALNDTRPGFNTVGTYTWTMMDYYGEGHSFPQVGSSYGQFDRTVFAKQAARYYRAAWLTSRPATVPGRPPVVAAPEVSIVESWDTAGKAARDIHVYCGGDGVTAATLSVNGKAVGAPQPCAGYTYATFKGVAFAAGSITATATDAAGAALATSTTHTSGAAASLVLSVDAPHPSTGTGTAVLADGTDVAMIRATVLDAAGNRARGSADNVTFAVTGAAELIGCGNGDPDNLVPPHSATCPAYHGLARAVVRVRQVSAGTAAEHARLVAVHGGAARLRAAGLTVAAPGSADASTSFTVSASAAGLKPGSVDVAVSSDSAADGVLAVASRFAANVSLSLGE